MAAFDEIANMSLEGLATTKDEEHLKKGEEREDRESSEGKERLLGVITRAVRKPKGWFDTLKDRVLVFSNERLFILDGSITKGIGMSAVFGIAGSIWGIKELLDEDKLERLPIDEIEEKARRIIPLSSIRKIEVKKSGLAQEILVVSSEEELAFRTLEGYDRVKSVLDRVMESV